MNSRKKKASHSSTWIIPVLLLLMLFAQVNYASTQTSMTLDEPLHITSGFACLSTGDYRLTEEHPPLLKMFQAFPVLWLKDQLPDITTVPGWQEADLVIAAQHFIVPFRPIDSVVIPARIPTMLVAVFLGAFVYRWAKDTAGIRGANLALFFYVFDPNILAHSALAATDIGAAWGIFVTSYLFWRWIRRRRPRWCDALSTGFVLGLGMGLKMTVLILGPIFAAFVMYRAWTSRDWRRIIVQSGLIVFTSLMVLWAIYGFEFGPIPELPFPIPFPSHMLPVRRVLNHVEGGHAAFLMGDNYLYGNWRYFPVAFALKTPLLSLSTLGLGIIYSLTRLIQKRPQQRFRYRLTLVSLAALPVVYFTASMTSTINIGYRHLLPLLPFIFVFCALTLVDLDQLLSQSKVKQSIYRVGATLLLGLYGLMSLLISPWHLAYFNAIAGGPDNGYKYLVDSNLDWGQAWKALASYQQDNNVSNMFFSDFTFNEPEAYGITFTPLTPWQQAETMLADRFEPAPGTYAISTTQLQGVVVALPEMYDYFRHLEPVAKIGYAIHIYQIPETPAAVWLAQCNHPVTALTEDMILEGFRSEQAQRISFDCTQTWLIPPGKGITIIPHSADSLSSIIASGQELRLAFSQDHTAWAPPFSIYERAASAPLPVPQVPAFSDDIPVKLAEILQFEGYTLVNTEDALTVVTYWKVLDMPDGALSLMAHIHDDSDNVVGVADGLGASYTELIPDSLIIQKHDFSADLARTEAPLTLWVGAYSWPDLVRYPVTVNGLSRGDAYNAGALDFD